VIKHSVCLESLKIILDIGSFLLELKSTYCRHLLGAFIFMNIIILKKWTRNEENTKSQSKRI
jgi:hypothetical protein